MTPAKTPPLAVSLDAAGLDDNFGQDAAAGYPRRAPDTAIGYREMLSPKSPQSSFTK